MGLGSLGFLGFCGTKTLQRTIRLFAYMVTPKPVRVKRRTGFFWLDGRKGLPAQLTRRVRSSALEPVGAAMREGSVVGRFNGTMNAGCVNGGTRYGGPVAF